MTNILGNGVCKGNWNVQPHPSSHNSKFAKRINLDFRDVALRRIKTMLDILLTPMLAKKSVLESARKIQKTVSLEDWSYIGKLKQLH